MEYNILVNNKEYGPINEETLIKWAEDSRILPNTSVKNSMVNGWKKASEYSFLANAFELQKSDYEAKAGFCEKRSKKLAIADRDNALTENEPKTAFENEYLPVRVKIFLRLKAGIVDLVLLGIVFFIIFTIGLSISDTYSLNHNDAIVIIYCVFLAFSILYLGGCIAVFAQTLGMWFFGILLVRNCDEATEVYFLRAYFYALLMIIFGLISPISNFILFRKRALHDLISDTQVVSISAKPR